MFLGHHTRTQNQQQAAGFSEGELAYWEVFVESVHSFCGFLLFVVAIVADVAHIIFILYLYLNITASITLHHLSSCSLFL